METNNTITEDEMLENSFPLDDSKNFREKNNEVKRTPGKWRYEEHDPKISRFAGNIISELGKGENGIMNIRTIDIILNHNGKDEANANAEFICEAVNNYDKLKEDKERLNKLLYDLTPGGSEFVDDPKYCALYAREQINCIPSVIRPIKKENIRLKEDNALLLEALKEIVSSYRMCVKKADQSEYVINAEKAIRKVENK